MGGKMFAFAGAAYGVGGCAYVGRAVMPGSKKVSRACG